MNVIGVDTPTVDEHDEKRDLDFTSFERLNDMNVPFPNLKPGRALVNLESNELIEMYHSMMGNWKTSGGTLSFLEERRLDDKVGTEWGGIMQEEYVGHRITECPASNRHGEVPVPTERPEKSEIVERSPEEFRENVLQMDEKVPFMLLERPSVDYAEIDTGETYEVIGSYFPNERDPEERVREPGAIQEAFDGLEIEIGRTEVEGHPVVELPAFNVSLSWEDVTEGAVIRLEESDGQVEAVVADEEATMHLFDYHTDAYHTDRVHIDSPKSAKEDIKDLDWEHAHPNWDTEFGEYGAWRFDAEAFEHAVSHFLECEYTVSVSPDVIATIGVESTEYVSYVTDAEEVAFDEEHRAVAEYESSVASVTDGWETEKSVSIQAGQVDNPTLLALDLTLGAGEANLGAGMSVGGALETIDSIPESVVEAWQPAGGERENEAYEWYNPSSGARVGVEEVEGKWGPEFEITVEHAYTESEVVVTLAGERDVVETVITHLRAMS